MTNLIAQLIITLTLGTNWTGSIRDGQELGYIVTNHVATVTYEGQTQQFTLQSVPGNVAVWRPQPVNEVQYLRETAYLTNVIPMWFWNGTSEMKLSP